MPTANNVLRQQSKPFKNLTIFGWIMVAFLFSMPFSASALVPTEDDDNDGIINGPVHVPIGADVTFFIKLQDNCPATANSDQLDFENDGLGDVCDSDDDNNGVADIDTDNDGQSNVVDTDDDNDGIPDSWELQNGLNPLVADASVDPDNDGIINSAEYQNDTDPQSYNYFSDQVAGVMPGEFSVSEGGSANYQIPLAVPPGTAGMQPSLSLNYNSGGGNGLVGVGWGLAGLSVIGRCPSTEVQDGVIDGIDFDSKDRFCIDGQRLIAISGSYGASGTEYRTEQDGFTKVVSYGTQASGPEYFIANTKSGQIIHYGNTADSRIEAQGKSDVVIWAANRITDTVGNYLSIEYDENNADGSYTPKVINYTGNDSAGLTPNSKVEMEYETRSDVTTIFVDGSKFKTTKRLKNVKTYVDSALVRDYQLSYDNLGAVNRSRLTQVQECDATAACYPATTFDWHTDSDVPVLFSSTRSVTPYKAWNSATTGDFNGDGHEDYMINTATSGAGWYVYLSNGDGSFTFKGSVTPYHQWHSATTGDFNGDGMTDFMINTTTSGAGWYVYLSDGDGTFTHTGSLTTYPQWHSPMPGDFNGDGLTDMMINTKTSGAGWYTYLSDGDGTFTKVPGTFSPYHQWHSATPGDFNGDGLTDFMINTTTSGAGWYTYLSDGDGTFTFKGSVTPYYQWHSVTPGDFNGDGMTDFMINTTTSGAGWYTYLSDGDGTFSKVAGSFTPYHQWHSATPGDFDGDGLTDMMINTTTANAGWYLYKSDGDGTFTKETGSVTPYYQWNSIAVGDFDGDGLDGFLINTATNGAAAGWQLRQRIKNYEHPRRDVISSIYDGLRNQTDIVYKPLTDNSVYTKGTGSSYPEVDVQAAMHVVSKVSVSDGIGALRDTTYKYEGLRSSVLRGSLGFAAMNSTDELLGMSTRTEYNQTYPFTGQVVRSVQTFDNGTATTSDDVVLSEVASSFASIKTHTGTETVASHSGIVFAYADTLTKKNYKLDGTLVSTVTTTNEYDNFGNPTSIVVDTAGLDYEGVMETYRTATTNTYTNDTSNWYLGRLTRAEVTQTLPSGESGTRVSEFSYDAATGLLAQEVVEPDTPELKLVTDYVYDVYGNKTSVTVSGGNGATAVAARSTTSTFDVRGQFATTTTNALGHSETHTFDNRFGVMLSMTGPNNLTTTWGYDSFGRKVSEMRSDGTESIIIREWCDGFQGLTGNPFCPTGGALAVTTQTDGAATTAAFSDALGRVTRSATVGRDGSIIFADTQYNARGEVTQKSLPYFDGDTPLWSTFHYDALSRVYREISPDGSQNNTGFNGLSTTAINALNQINERTKNVLGNVTQVYDADANDTYYRYDPFGNLVETEDADGNIISNTFDIRGRKIAMSDPDMGDWTYTYNALGELVSQTDAKSQTSTMVYDLLGRMTSRVETEGASTWLYDTAPNGIGKLHSETGPLGNTKTLSYDSLGRATNVNTTIESTSFDVATSYDSLSRVESITYPQSTKYPFGLTVDYAYTDVASDGTDGFLKTVSNNVDGTVYWEATEQNAAGQLTDIMLGNGVNTSYNYDPETNRVSGIQSGTTIGGHDIQT